MSINYSKLVPPGTFIHQYMEHMNETETATAYDFWCACWLLSLAAGRDCVVARPRAPVYLNLYCILVANSGITRKSSAVSEAKKLAQLLIADDPRISIMDSKSTPERIDEQLQRHSSETGSGRLAIIVSELAVFLGTEKYTANMPAMLTDLYDCPDRREAGGGVSRRTSGSANVFVSLLSASTPTWLLRSVNPNVVEGGFTSRCLFIVSEAPKRRIAWPTVDTRSHTGRDVLLQQLREIRSTAATQKTITINDGGLAAFKTWYEKRKPSLDTFSNSFESREDAHILRLAAFLCMNDGTWVIQKTHITTATKLVTNAKIEAARLFGNAEEASKWLHAVVTLRDSLVAAGLDGILKSHLYLKVRRQLDSMEYNALLDIMHELNYIQRFERKDGPGRPAEIIRGTKLLATKRVIEDITAKVNL